MTTRKYKRNDKADKRRRADRIMAARLQEDLLRVKRLERVRDVGQRSIGNTGVYTTSMPVVEPGLLGKARRIVDASVGAVALVGENLGTERWRHPRCHLGLFINPARRTESS